MSSYLLVCLISYFFGTFPSGRLISFSKGVDITAKGSGNVGATNVARTLGKTAGVLALLLDVVKGVVAPLLVGYLGYDAQLVALSGVAVVFGHCFSIPGLMRGGKGVATSLGAFLVIATIPTLCGFASFVVLFYSLRLVSLGSLAGMNVPFIAGYLLGYPTDDVLAMATVAMLVSYRHKDNIARLLRGEETRFKAAPE